MAIALATPLHHVYFMGTWSSPFDFPVIPQAHAWPFDHKWNTPSQDQAFDCILGTEPVDRRGQLCILPHQSIQHRTLNFDLLPSVVAHLSPRSGMPGSFCLGCINGVRVGMHSITLRTPHLPGSSHHAISIATLSIHAHLTTGRSLPRKVASLLPSSRNNWRVPRPGRGPYNAVSGITRYVLAYSNRSHGSTCDRMELDIGYFANSVPVDRLTDRSPRSHRFRARLTSPSTPWRLATSFKRQVLNVERSDAWGSLSLNQNATLRNGDTPPLRRNQRPKY